MPRRWKNGGPRESDTAQNFCGCKGTWREHRCDDERDDAAPRRDDVAPWLKRALDAGGDPRGLGARPPRGRERRKT